MGFWEKLSGGGDEEASTKNAGQATNSPKPTNRTAATSSSSGAQSKNPESVRSALGKGTVIQGKLSFDTPVQIDGKLKGEVFSTDTLIVGATGEIDADIDVRSLVVHGRVQGTVRVKENITLAASAVVAAEMSAGSLSVEEGAVFNGTCAMKSRSEQALTEQEAAAVKSAASQAKGYQVSPKDESAQKKSATAIITPKANEGSSTRPPVAKV